jgi:hypothetical protein
MENVCVCVCARACVLTTALMRKFLSSLKKQILDKGYLLI